MESTFSDIAAATRNIALGQVLADEGHTVAARKSERYLKQRVRYGELVKEYGDVKIRWDHRRAREGQLLVCWGRSLG